MKREDARDIAGRCVHLQRRIQVARHGLPMRAADGPARLRAYLGHPPDLVVRPLGAGIQVVFLRTIVDVARVEAAIIRPLTDQVARGSRPPATIGIEMKRVLTYRAAAQSLLLAHAVVLVGGAPGGWAIPAERWPKRQISEPPSEFISEGPHAGFIENLDTNIALIRHSVPQPRLRWRRFPTGRRTGTHGALVYMDGLVPPRMLARVRRRLRGAGPSFVTDAAMLREWLAPRAGSLLPMISRTERPDSAVAAVLEGRIVILVSGSPSALVIPSVFTDLMHVAADYYTRPFTANSVRMIRMAGLMVSLTASASLVAFATVNQELIPAPLLVSFAQASRAVPLPLTIEVLILEFVVEIIREAGLRLPSPVGQSVSIIGAVVIGQSAVTAGLISAPAIVIVSLAFIASYVIPSQDLVRTLRIFRFGLILLGATLGVFGVALSLLLLFAYASSLDSFGVPFLAPLTPLRRRGTQDALWRRPLPRLRRAFFARHDGGAGPW